MHVLRSLSLSFTLLLAAQPTAQAIIAQASGLTNPQQVITFGASLFPNFTPVSTQFAGVTLTHARYYTTSSVNNLVGGFLTNDPIGPPDTLRIQFAQPIRDLSFVYHQIGQTAPSTIRAVLLGTTVASFSGTWNQAQPNNYFGFTNTVFDELQVDFVGDFNVDTLAFNLANGALCEFFNGTGINPIGFSCLTLPVLGTTWQGAVPMSANTLLTGLIYAPGGIGTPLPLFGGELLVQPSPSPSLFTGATSYSLALPGASSWIGTELAFQALRLDLVGGAPEIVMLNGMRLRIGL